MVERGHDTDAAARSAAIDPMRSLLLQAPAGSGKTTLLTQRFLRLLAEVEQPEQILAVTFTRKAAAEMRARILGSLRACEQPGADPLRADSGELRTRELAGRALARSRQLGWDLQSNPSRLRIQTIDGLNRSLAARLPIAAAAGQSLQVTGRDRQLYGQAARRTLLDAESDAEMQPHSGLLQQRLDNNWLRLESLLADMLARRSHWLRHVADGEALDLRRRVEGTLAAIVAEALRDARLTIPAALRHESLWLATQAEAPRDTALAHWLGTRDDLGEHPDDLRAWCAVGRLALTEAGALRKKLDARNGIPASNRTLRARALAWLGDLGTQPGAVRHLDALLSLPPVEFEPTDAAVLESLVRLLRYAAGQLELLFRDVGRVDYGAIAAAARSALRDDDAGSELTIHQGERLGHLLVDEFQDTSLDQFELLEALTRDWAPGDGRSLFLVGDPMQSIYQFREAEVGLFLRARAAGIGRIALEPLALTLNFRSDPTIVEFVNRTFAAVFPAQDDAREAAVRYLPCEAAGVQSSRVRPRVRLRHLDASAEAAAVLDIVRSLRAEAPGASIAVLVAVRSHAAPIARALRAGGIAVQGVDLIPLGEVPAVQDLMSLTRALLDPLDRSAWLAVLRAPWCGLRLAALSALLEAAPQSTLAELLGDEGRTRSLSDDDRARLGHVEAVLAAAQAQLGRAPLAAVVEMAWLDLGGAVAYGSGSAALDARRFLDAFAEREQSGEWDGADDLAPLVERLFAASDSGAAEAVQIMTMHRAKGLEFDAVILPSLGRPARRDDELLLSYIEWPDDAGAARLLLAPVRAPESDDPAPLGAWIRSLQNSRREHERVRQLYVAATRARSALYLLGSLDGGGAAAPPSPRAGSLLASLWPALAREFPSNPEPQHGDAAAVTPIETPAPTSLRVAAPWQRPLLAAHGGRAAVLPVSSVELAETPQTLLRAGPMTRHVAQVVHDELCALPGRKNIAGVTDAVVDVERWRRLLAAQGVGGSELDVLAGRVGEVLSRVRSDPQGRWLLDPRHRGALDGIGLSGLYEARLTSVKIDRSFIDEQGTRWLVDYRVSPHEGGDVEAFVAAELSEAEPRMRRGAALAAALGPEPVRAALYFPLLPRLVECRLSR